MPDKCTLSRATCHWFRTNVPCLEPFVTGSGKEYPVLCHLLLVPYKYPVLNHLSLIPNKRTLSWATCHWSPPWPCSPRLASSPTCCCRNGSTAPQVIPAAPSTPPSPPLSPANQFNYKVLTLFIFSYWTSMLWWHIYPFEKNRFFPLQSLINLPSIVYR